MPDSMLIADSTLVDVANRILDMGEAAVTSISQSLKEIAPQTWEILMRQVYVDALTNLLVCVLIGIIIYPIFKWSYRGWRNDKYSDGFLATSIISGVLGVADLVLIAVSTTALTKVLINPQYYAVMKFFELTGLK